MIEKAYIKTEGDTLEARGSKIELIYLLTRAICMFHEENLFTWEELLKGLEVQLESRKEKKDNGKD